MPRDLGTIQRTDLKKQGDMQRDTQRNRIEQGELALRQKTQGFQSRAARQMEDLRSNYLAEKDPTARGFMLQNVRALQGREGPPEWGVR